MVNFIKALSSPEHLQIIGTLSKGPMTAAQVAEATGLPLRVAFNHLEFLEHMHVVLGQANIKKQEATYKLDAVFLEGLARQQFEGKRPEVAPPKEANQETRRAQKKFLNPDGTIRQIPNRRTAAFGVILNYVMNSFESDRTYTEKEINGILKRFHEDVSGLRRDLVDAGMLARERDGSRYWRSDEKTRLA